MKAPAFLALLTPIGWAIVAACLAPVVGLGWWTLTEPGRARQRAAEAHAASVVSDARTKAAADAVEVVAGQAASEASTDETTRKNADAISAAPGADKPIDPAVADAGLRALCLRHSYSHNPRCVALLNPRTH